MEDDSKIKQALEQCAVGLSTSETVEEYVMENNELRLVKKKVTTKDVPPDIKAVKMLMEGAASVEGSDEELRAERDRLINMLKENDSD